MSFDALRRADIEDGGFDAVNMGRLRDAADRERLGSKVVKEIRVGLDKCGLGSYGKLSTAQHDRVCIYDLNSFFADIVRFLQDPNPHHARSLREMLKLSDKFVIWCPDFNNV